MVEDCKSEAVQLWLIAKGLQIVKRGEALFLINGGLLIYTRILNLLPRQPRRRKPESAAEAYIRGL